jgi:hypothetical protein
MFSWPFGRFPELKSLLGRFGMSRWERAPRLEGKFDPGEWPMVPIASATSNGLGSRFAGKHDPISFTLLTKLTGLYVDDVTIKFPLVIHFV